MRRNTVYFILPCAGEGRRLGWGGPKELFPIFSDKRLIDFTLDHIREAAHELSGSDATSGAPIHPTADHTRYDLSVIVVTQPWKTDVPEYVAGQLPGIPVRTVMFNPELFEWPGSVHSAQPHYGDINIVLLPDSFLSLSPEAPARDPAGKQLIHYILSSLARHSVVFGYRPCTHPGQLKQLGALHVTDGIVSAFQDKPATHLQLYNGFWCCYAFTRPMGTPLYRFLQQSVARTPVNIQNEPFHPAGAFPVHNYMDLGTPAAIESFRAQYGNPRYSR
ncbi:MAG TPA: hypothetical protein PLV45_12485 [bacterium]|nr:hypothetical protein [bacterium]